MLSPPGFPATLLFFSTSKKARLSPTRMSEKHWQWQQIGKILWKVFSQGRARKFFLPYLREPSARQMTSRSTNSRKKKQRRHWMTLAGKKGMTVFGRKADSCWDSR